MKDCSTCGNRQENGRCRTMKNKPREKWCYQTTEQAIETEKAIIEYIDKHPGQTDEEVKFNNQNRKWALTHIGRLNGGVTC